MKWCITVFRDTPFILYKAVVHNGFELACRYKKEDRLAFFYMKVTNDNVFVAFYIALFIGIYYLCSGFY